MLEAPDFIDGMHPSSDWATIGRHVTAVPMILIGSIWSIRKDNS